MKRPTTRQRGAGQADGTNGMLADSDGRSPECQQHLKAQSPFLDLPRSRNRSRPDGVIYPDTIGLGISLDPRTPSELANFPGHRPPIHPIACLPATLRTRLPVGHLHIPPLCNHKHPLPLARTCARMGCLLASTQGGPHISEHMYK